MLIVLAMVLSGCSGYPKGVERPRETDYRSGTKGLELSFPADTFSKLYENDDARFIVEIK